MVVTPETSTPLFGIAVSMHTHDVAGWDSLHRMILVGIVGELESISFGHRPLIKKGRTYMGLAQGASLASGWCALLLLQGVCAYSIERLVQWRFDNWVRAHWDVHCVEQWSAQSIKLTSLVSSLSPNVPLSRPLPCPTMLYRTRWKSSSSWRQA